jgi:7-cyano-7-deazaguanine synthase in queuosine biosynthesis
MSIEVSAGRNDGQLVVSLANEKGLRTQPVAYDLQALFPLTQLANAPELLEFFELMLVFYTADRLSKRSRHTWRRDFKIVFPVRRVSLWQSARDTVQDLIWSCTGDQVGLHIAERSGPGILRSPHFALEHPCETEVVLLSDGLDSLCGAFERAKAPVENSAFVSVNTNTRTGARLRAIRAGLQEVLGARASFFEVGLNLVKAPREQERTQRSRTMLSIAAGLTAAAAQASRRVWVCENGMGILNLPISSIQADHEASQVLHPRNLAKWKAVSDLLIGGASVFYPNRYKTKAQMVAALPERALRLIAQTSSCDHPQRYDANAGCGVCGSCVYRKMALMPSGRTGHDGQYSKSAPKSWDFQPVDLLRHHARTLNGALNEPDSWAALVRLQPTLREAIEDSGQRAHEVAALVELLRRHIDEVASFKEIVHAA